MASSSSSDPPSPLFELIFKDGRSLSRALRILVLTAASSDGTTVDSGNLYIMATGDIIFTARNTTPPYIDTCLRLGKEVTGCVDNRDGLVMRLNLGFLVKQMTRTIAGRNGLTLILTAQNEREIVYTLKQENDEVHSSVIPVISTYMGHPDEMGLYWSSFFRGLILSVDIPVSILIGAIKANESPVAEYAFVLQLGNKMIVIRESEFHQVVNHTRPLPLRTPYISFHPRAAIANAVVDLSPPTVIFHTSADSRCVLQIKVNKVGIIYFCFNAH